MYKLNLEGMMMFKFVFIILLYFCPTMLKANNVDLYKIYLEADKDSEKIVKNKFNKKLIASYYKKYFYNEFNLLYSALGTSDLGDCGSLYLKESCYLFSYHHEQVIKENEIGCLYIYARPKLKPDEYLIQKAVLFKKYKDVWKIIGSRTALRLLKDYTYLSFHGERPISMFPDICKSTSEISKLQSEIYNSESNRDY